MAWREALDDARNDAELAQLEAEVRATERGLLAQLALLLDEENQPALAAERVRALMFIARFKSDLARRLEALES
jgi:molecular chaperone HscB